MYDSIYHSLVFILDKVYDNYIVKLKRSHGKLARRTIDLLFIFCFLFVEIFFNMEVFE